MSYYHSIAELTVHFSSQKQLLQIHHKCLNYCLSILSIVRVNQNTSNLATVKVCSNYMKRASNPSSEDFPFDPTTMICMFDLLWNGLLTNDENLNYFVKNGCIYTLIDLIEVRWNPLSNRNHYILCRKVFFL